MSTRSRIALQHADGSITSIYCHSDGYPSHNGKLLFEHYQDEAKIKELLTLGNISSLAPEIGNKHNFDWYSVLHDNYKKPGEFGTDYEALRADPVYQSLSKMVNAYARDRGECLDYMVSPNFDHFTKHDAAEAWEEFVYLFREGGWFAAATTFHDGVSGVGKFVPLALVITDEGLLYLSDDTEEEAPEYIGVM